MTRSAADRDLSVMTWMLAVIIAFALLLGLVTVISLSDMGIAGWMAGLSAGTRVLLAAFLDA